MSQAETELEMIERHIRRSEVLIARQWEILDNDAIGDGVRLQAERLLIQMEKTLSLHYEHRIRLLARPGR